MNKLDPKIRVSDAIDRYGSQSELARALDITRAAVSIWAKKDEYVPPLIAHRLMILQPTYFKTVLVN